MAELLTVTETAQRLGITKASVYEAVREGRLACVRVLGKIGIPESAVTSYAPRAYRERAGSSPVGRPRTRPETPNALKRPRGRPRKVEAES